VGGARVVGSIFFALLVYLNKLLLRSERNTEADHATTLLPLRQVHPGGISIGRPDMAGGFFQAQTSVSVAGVVLPALWRGARYRPSVLVWRSKNKLVVHCNVTTNNCYFYSQKTLLFFCERDTSAVFGRHVVCSLQPDNPIEAFAKYDFAESPRMDYLVTT
jgi:hypothetical protein